MAEYCDDLERQFTDERILVQVHEEDSEVGFDRQRLKEDSLHRQQMSRLALE
jgi:hypothetical protein